MISCNLNTDRIIEILNPINKKVTKNVNINYITTKDDLCDSCIIFIKEVSNELKEKVQRFKDVVLITENSLDDYEFHLQVENTRLAMARIFDFIKPKSLYTINNMTFISNKSHVSETAVIEPFVFIDEGVKIGANSFIKSGSRIYSNTTIGNNVIVRENSIIGGQGFGVEKDENGNNFKIYHFGGVVIGDYVEIGALNTIVSGTINPTIISDYTKIDDHVHIAHNCKIGRNCIITAGTILSGSVEIGDDCWIGPNSSVKNSLKISPNTLVGIGSVVTKDIDKPGSTFAGNPAKEFRKYIDEKRKFDFFIYNFDKYKKIIDEEEI